MPAEVVTFVASGRALSSSSRFARVSYAVVAATLAACASPAGAPGDLDTPSATGDGSGSGSSPPEPPPSRPTGENAPPPPKLPAPLSLVAVTFNTGIHDKDPDDDFSGSNGKIAEDYYGSGLSWNAAIQDTKAWFASVAPDVVALQEIFDPEECPKVPADKKAGFVCATWKPGDPTVAQTILGPGYQVACHKGTHDKCAAVKLSFGKFRGCAGAVCPDGLGGAPVPSCGSAARVGRGVIDLVGGGTLTLVSVHASAGFEAKNFDCRKKQFEQIFVDLDGAPAANGTTNVILGDFNTDPGRLTGIDASAKALADHVKAPHPFRFVTDVGSSATPTYRQSLVPFLPIGFNIDHVVSEKLKGSCWNAGVTPGHPSVSTTDYFDHTPAVCTLHE